MRGRARRVFCRSGRRVWPAVRHAARCVPVHVARCMLQRWSRVTADACTTTLTIMRVKLSIDQCVVVWCMLHSCLLCAAWAFIEHCIGAVCCVLHAACCMLRVACCMLRVACCVLHAARCVLRVACCVVHVACCALRAYCCGSAPDRLSYGSVRLPASRRGHIRSARVSEPIRLCCSDGCAVHRTIIVLQRYYCYVAVLRSTP